MKKQLVISNTQIEKNDYLQGESIEQKMRRVTETNEPIKGDGSPLIYTERKDGVLPEYDVRTDRFEIAQDAMDIVHKTNIAKRQEALKPKQEPKNE